MGISTINDNGDIFLDESGDPFSYQGAEDGIIIRGGNGDDVIAGNAGDNILAGGGGNDFLLGGIGDDLLQGGNGADILFGGQGSDQLFGGSGTDFLSGDIGNDTLSGGGGSDIFSLNVRDGVLGNSFDTVTDFTVGQDSLEIKNGDLANVSIADSGADLVVSYSGIDIAVLEGQAGATMGDLFVI